MLHKGVCIITGASTGIGEALAREMARRGYAVGLLARSADKLEALTAAIQQTGAQAAFAAADVTDRDGVTAAIAALEAKLGPCTVIVANAGTGKPSPAAKNPVDTCLEVMRLNYDGLLYSIGAVLPGMLSRRQGRLVAISSLAAFRGLPGTGAYSASKAAVSALMESYRVDLQATGVGVSIVHPGFIKTPLTDKNNFPMPFIMPAERAVSIIADGIEQGRRYIDFPWQMRWLVGLARLFPGWLWDRVMAKQGG